MSYQYFYLVWAFIFLIIWAVFFFQRKDFRREMFIMSLIFGLGGLFAQPIYILDYWKPLTITGTYIGIEDFLIGFAIGGIASIIYEIVMKKRNVRAPSRQKIWRDSYAFFGSFGFLFLILFYMFNIDSIHTTIIAYLISISVVLFLRNDLIIVSVISGIYMLCIGIGVYLLLFIPYPNYIKEFWFFSGHWYEIGIFGIPLSEYLWYFLTGAFIGPLYEFIEGLTKRSLPRYTQKP